MADLGVFWLVASFSIVGVYLILNNVKNLPEHLYDLCFYGKLKGKRTKWSIIQLSEVPKSWFTYFYLLGVFVNGAALFFVSDAYLNKQPLPTLVQSLLNVLVTRKETSTDAVAAILLIGMMFVQNIRRLSECVLVSVYSRSTMNLMHFGLGLLLYSTFFLAVLAEAPATTDVSIALSFRWNHLLGLMLFTWASWHHNRSHVTLASLRKNEKGDVVNYEHPIPRGGWFELVSCPHYLMEIVIYFSFVVVGGLHHKTLLSVVAFVVSNQLICGHTTHSWYKERFKSYPPERRAIIPYVF